MLFFLLQLQYYFSVLSSYIVATKLHEVMREHMKSKKSRSRCRRVIIHFPMLVMFLNVVLTWYSDSFLLLISSYITGGSTALGIGVYFIRSKSKVLRQLGEKKSSINIAAQENRMIRLRDSLKYLYISAILMILQLFSFLLHYSAWIFKLNFAVYRYGAHISVIASSVSGLIQVVSFPEVRQLMNKCSFRRAERSATGQAVSAQ